jgi:hypothetical protein
MRFQKFCSNNQEAIFLVTVAVVFCLSLSRLNLCEAVLGLMLMGYGLAICFASHAFKLPILELYFMASLLLKVGHNNVSWHYILGGLFLFYIYSLAVMLFPSLDLENIVSSLKESQKNVTLHMVTEFKYFRSLETLLILYWGLQLTFPEGFKMVFGELHYLIMHFVYYGLLCSVLAKLVAMNLFNPLTDKKMNMLGTGAGITSTVLGLTMLDMQLEDKAIGGSQEPTPGPDTDRRQFARLGYTSTTKSGLRVGKAWTDVHGTVPPCISGSKQIDVHETVRLLQEEKDPVLKQRVQYFLPDAVLPEPAKKTPKPSISAVFIMNSKIIDHSVWSKIEADSAQKGPEWLEIKPKSHAMSKLTLDGKPLDKFLPSETEPDWAQKVPERVEVKPKSGLASILNLTGKATFSPLPSDIEPDLAQKVPERVEVKPKSGLASILNLTGKPSFPPLPSDIEPDLAQKVPERVEVKPKSGFPSKLNLTGKPIFQQVPSSIEPDSAQKVPESVEVKPKSGLAPKLGFDGKPLDQPVSPKIVPDLERKKSDATIIADAVKSIMDARSRKL